MAETYDRIWVEHIFIGAAFHVNARFSEARGKMSHLYDRENSYKKTDL
jgi:hypothetical protein